MSDSITADPKQIVLRYKLSSAPGAGSNDKVYVLILYEEEVRIDPIGNEILIVQKKKKKKKKNIISYIRCHINHIQLV